MPSAWPAPATRTNSDGHVWPAGHGGPARSAHARTANNPPGTPQTADFGPFFVRRANFIALAPTIRPSRENFFAHRTQPRGNCETAITSATADAGQRETAITSATADAGQRETTITNATEKRIKNAHFSPAKAMAVSVGAEPARAKAMSVSSEARPARAKATPVSRERFVIPVDYGGAWPGFNPTRRATHQRPGTAGVEGAGGSGGPGCGARGRWRGLAGLRDDAPSEARSADGERAGRRPRAHQAARPDESGPTAPRTPAEPQATSSIANSGCGGRGRWRGLAGLVTAHWRHWCGGRRRVRRARAGFEIDHSEPQARVWRSRGRPGPTAPGTPAGPRQTALTLRRRARSVPCS